ncbi:hypothetical protein PO124_20580 [Bacillus licheniformis]|nr:hypothetical protein [Bacillus licheniformis]
MRGMKTLGLRMEAHEQMPGNRGVLDDHPAVKRFITQGCRPIRDMSLPSGKVRASEA